MFLQILISNGFAFGNPSDHRVVHIKLINSFIVRKEVSVIEEQILPLFEVLRNESNPAALQAFFSVIAEIVELFAETDMEKARHVVQDIVSPIIWELTLRLTNVGICQFLHVA